MASLSLPPAILPPATLGMLGGGQLGRFFVIAARQMGYRVWVLDPDPHSPAGALADRHLLADYLDFVALDTLAAGCAAVSTEFENVPAAALDYLAKFVTVRPSATAVAVCQDRIAEKSFLSDNGLPHAPFAVIRSEDDVSAIDAGLFPGILKIARFGYDGKGQAVVDSPAAALAAWQQFKGDPCVLERKLSLDYEISVVLARCGDGEVRCFPPAENSHRHGILDTSLVPAQTGAGASLTKAAEELAATVARCLDYEGVLGVEFFVADGRLVINEMAPRPHNTGHYTLDACVSSQFEQQVRVMCGLPLGDPRAHSAAVMVNLLGDLWFETGASGERYREPDWSRLLAVPNLKLHLYGKHHARRGRKMGHLTVVDTEPLRAQEIARAARAAIGIGDD